MIGPLEILLFLAIVAVVIWLAWILCLRVGWSHWLAVLLLVPVAGYVFLAVLVWEALPQAGYSRWPILLLLVPILNVLLLFWLSGQC